MDGKIAILRLSLNILKIFIKYLSVFKKGYEILTYPKYHETTPDYFEIWIIFPVYQWKIGLSIGIRGIVRAK